MSRIKSIPTTYNRITFRSRREADWARIFDERSMRWCYEEEGVQISDVRYLPDFWLPEIRTFAEVKGILDPISEVKVRSLAAAVSDNARLVVLAGSPREVEWWPVYAAMPFERAVGLLPCDECRLWQFRVDGRCRACWQGHVDDPKLWRWYAQEYARHGRLKQALEAAAMAEKLGA